jgi:hypothetical protein
MGTGADHDGTGHLGPSCECAWLSGFGYFKVTAMSVVVRVLLGWTALSVAVTPALGALLHRLQLDTVPVPGSDG